MYCGKDVYCPPGSHPMACPSCPTSGVLDPLGLHALYCAGGHFTCTAHHNRVANTFSDAVKGEWYYLVRLVSRTFIIVVVIIIIIIITSN